jgi:TonB family protein
MMWFDILVQWHQESVRSPRYQVLMLPKPQISQRKVLWYDFRKSVPEVAAEKRFGVSNSPQGEKDALGRTLIAQSRTPASKQQFIWQPKHPEPIPADIPAPNVASLPTELAPVPKVPLKAFTPPPADRPKANPSLIVEPPPAIHSSVADLRDAHLLRELSQKGLESVKKPPLKQFVPPTAQSKTDAGPPKLIEPPSVTAQTGAGGSVQAVILGLNPADRFTAPIPAGSRSAQFAHAPAAGSPSSGASSSPDAPRAPGVTAHASQGQSGSAAASQPDGAVPELRTITEIVFPAVNRTMSAPLRPSSRIVPATVEARFAGRDVFALVVPGPKLVGYAGDWVLWFAPHQTENGVGARIQAPIPSRKENSSGDIQSTPDSTGKGSVQFQAIIDSKGRVLSPQILRGLNSEAFRRRAIAELRTWEFKPSLRNGEAIDVDVVLEIPFEFRPPTSQTR